MAKIVLCHATYADALEMDAIPHWGVAIGAIFCPGAGATDPEYIVACVCKIVDRISAKPTTQNAPVIVTGDVR